MFLILGEVCFNQDVLRSGKGEEVTIMGRRSLLLIIAVAFLFLGRASAQQTQTVCSNVGNPAGWVTIHIFTDVTKCFGGQNDVKVIEQINTLDSAATVNACNDGSALPSGWVVTDFASSASDCGGGTNDIKALRNLNGEPIGAQESVCILSTTVPTGWTVTGVTTDFQRCGGNQQDIGQLRHDSGPDLALSVSPVTATVVQGSSVSYQVHLNRSGGFTGAVALSATGLGSGASVVFSPNNTTGASSTMTVSTIASAATGTFTVSIAGVGTNTGGNMHRFTSATLTVQAAPPPPPPDFSLSASPQAQTIEQGADTSYTININRSGGFTGAVSFSASGLPGVSTGVTFNPSSTTGNVSTMTVSTTGGTPTGSSTLTISGDGTINGATATRTTTVTLNVLQHTTALRFVPVAPCRVADTRNPNGPFGGPFLSGGQTRAFVVPNSACNIPLSAQAYSLNVTVVPKSTLSFLTMFACGQPAPATSTLNSDGRVKAVAAITAADGNGAVCAFAHDDTDLILDINGYFVPDTNPSGLAFYPLAPCRVFDTRNPAGPLGGPSLLGGNARTFPVGSSICNVPSTATAYSMNFTAVPKATLGFLTVWAAGQPQPQVSTLNDPTGTTLANAAIVPAGANGDIAVFVSNDSDLVGDINGYFAPPGPGGLSLHVLSPCRVLDTRNPPGSQPFNGTLSINVASSSCIGSAAAQAYVLNATVVPSASLGYLTLWPAGSPQPLVSTLNAVDGVVTSNMALVPATNGSVNAFASNPTHLVVDILGYLAP